MSQTFTYVGSCVSLDGELIDWIRGRMRDIGGPKPDSMTYRAFAKWVPKSELQHSGLSRDWAVGFFQSSLPSGSTVLYYTHSGIEWVFIPTDASFDPEMEASIIAQRERESEA